VGRRLCNKPNTKHSISGNLLLWLTIVMIRDLCRRVPHTKLDKEQRGRGRVVFCGTVRTCFVIVGSWASPPTRPMRSTTWAVSPVVRSGSNHSLTTNEGKLTGLYFSAGPDHQELLLFFLLPFVSALITGTLGEQLHIPAA
jgi:hypothetical protein